MLPGSREKVQDRSSPNPSCRRDSEDCHIFVIGFRLEEIGIRNLSGSNNDTVLFGRWPQKAACMSLVFAIMS